MTKKTQITFRKQIKILPFLTLRIGKKSFSFRLGGRYLGVSIGSTGIYISGSLVGTGFGFRRKITPKKDTAKN
ncbi:DUF4236 domain-containing protein (plasmid) [Moritella sp. 24]|uniref:DUF4236 domain-containing protein n=1 Tax=Moritella sp. 24 TaxID=2746230 RepID=UPI001BAD1A16|nr:DUF4236 domain-containing protein [Moritella sp. 24]QUM78773.1 DUF4236 domain-containing protein [Moritella sp. 24]